MKDKKLKKVKKLVLGLDIDDESKNKINDILDSVDEKGEDIEDEVDVEETQEKPEEVASPEGDGKSEDEIPEPVDPLAPESEGDEEVPPTTEEVPPVEDTPLPKGMERIDPSQIGNEVPSVPNTDEPVPNPVTPDVPNVDYEQKIKEQNDLIEAQKKRIDSLEEALKKAGILTDSGETNQVGVDDNQAPANDPLDDPVERVLKEINGRR